MFLRDIYNCLVPHSHTFILSADYRKICLLNCDVVWQFMLVLRDAINFQNYSCLIPETLGTPVVDNSSYTFWFPLFILILSSWVPNSHFDKKCISHCYIILSTVFKQLSCQQVMTVALSFWTANFLSRVLLTVTTRTSHSVIQGRWKPFFHAVWKKEIRIIFHL